MTTSPSTTQRIDTHHHVVPPVYREWLAAHGVTAGGLAIPTWSRDTALAQMDALDIGTAVMSVSTPGVEPGRGEDAVAMARTVNDFCAAVVADDPHRFGFFATLALPDVEAATREACRALDELGADGVVLLANTSGRYVGDRALDPLMTELDRRGTVVFVHPSELRDPGPPGIPPFAADFLLDTTRAAVNIAKFGTLDDFSDIRFILSHGGGFVPYAAERLAYQCGRDVDDGLARLRRFYFDTALSASSAALPSLLAFADPTHITFGSDWPYAPFDKGRRFTANLDAHPISDEQRLLINTGNAETLLPRLTPVSA